MINIKKEKRAKIFKVPNATGNIPKSQWSFFGLKHPFKISLHYMLNGKKKNVWTTPNIDSYSLFPLKIILLVKSKT